jgi:hypothetical protein
VIIDKRNSPNSQKKVENFENPAIFWQLAGTYCLNMVISEKLNSLKYGNFGVFFPQKFFV